MHVSLSLHISLLCSALNFNPYTLCSPDSSKLHIFGDISEHDPLLVTASLLVNIHSVFMDLWQGSLKDMMWFRRQLSGKYTLTLTHYVYYSIDYRLLIYSYSFIYRYFLVLQHTKPQPVLCLVVCCAEHMQPLDAVRWHRHLVTATSPICRL